MSEKIAVKDVSPKGGAKKVNPATNKKNNDLYQKREKIYQRHVVGTFHKVRNVATWVTMAIYFIGPWLVWDGRQAVLFDLPARKFYIFGFTFWPQDFILLSWLLIIAAFSLFFVTALAGRVWCGYTCPQTVWTALYVWIEHRIEGDRNQRIKLDKQPWSINKATRKTIKHTLWFLLAFTTGYTFVGYFQPIKELTVDIIYFQAHGWAWFWLIFFTVATYMNAGWLREQVCLYMCPYARFQSAMFDKDTLIVTYDEKRGEPRGKRKKRIDPETIGLGDCINCQFCVQVCPTGIDIRDGLQYECITCAACIDACDQIMDQMGYDKGLIRYSTEHAMESGETHIIRPRLIGYGLALGVMIFAFWYVFFTRVPLQLDIIRDRNQLYRENVEGMIENTYTLKIMNMSQQVQQYQVSVSGLEGLHLNVPERITANAGELLVVPVNAEINPKLLKKPNHTIEFHVRSTSDDSTQVTEESRFIGPIKL
ncbi:MAG: cytochrome c oxidase accessory protein CcoG [Gammaproteobacteria bacterium]|nr:MAG: cytochrome c oxidase accessory protein CcoG [Gammaproteobacteria bacterium]